jgi:hypothetical protein
MHGQFIHILTGHKKPYATLQRFIAVCTLYDGLKPSQLSVMILKYCISGCVTFVAHGKTIATIRILSSLGICGEQLDIRRHHMKVCMDFIVRITFGGI